MRPPQELPQKLDGHLLNCVVAASKLPILATVVAVTQFVGCKLTLLLGTYVARHLAMTVARFCAACAY
jgi:hypothetical protein